MPGRSPFDPASTSSAVHATLDAALAEVPEGHNHAILIDGTYANGQATARLMYAMRIKKGDTFDWTIGGGIAYDGGDVSGGVATKVSW